MRDAISSGGSHLSWRPMACRYSSESRQELVCWFTIALLAALSGCDGCTHTAQRPASHAVARGSTSAVAPAHATAKPAPPRAVPPRPISPQSGCTVESGRVIFVWKGGSGARAELSRTRAFGRVERTVKKSGDVVDPPLGAGRWFWRIQRGSETSAVWPLHVVTRSAGPVRQGLIIGDDVNGDGLADVLVEDGVVFGDAKRTAAESARFALGPVRAPVLRLPAGAPPYWWGQPAGIGDVDGDGREDATVLVSRPPVTAAGIVPVRVWLRGKSALPKLWKAAGVLHHRAARLGDVNDDGYADVSDCYRSCRIFAGNPSGVSKTVLATLPDYDQLFGGDVNGDGRVDVVGRKGHTLAFYFNKRSGLPPHPDAEIHLKASVMARMADVDGDGLADVIGIQYVGEYRKAKAKSVFVVTGRSLEGKGAAATEWAWHGPALPDANTWSWDFLAHAGHAGLLVISPDSAASYARVGVYQISRTKGGAFRFPKSYDPAHCQAVINGHVRSIGDFDGDGWDDLLSMPAYDVGDTYSSIQFGSAKPFRNVCQALLVDDRFEHGVTFGDEP